MIAYPITLEDDDGTLLVTSPDFPELATFGDDREEAIARASHALEEAVAARIHDRKDIPSPSQGETYAILPTLTSVKVMLYKGMRDQGVGKAELARRLGWHMPQIDRVLDVRHRSRLDQMDAVLGAIGHRLHVTTAGSADRVVAGVGKEASHKGRYGQESSAKTERMAQAENRQMNIFETIEKTTHRIERSHSQFLADALCESLKGDRSLFDRVWELTAPSKWEIPDRLDQVQVLPEVVVEGGRVDICIRCFAPQDRVVGIEVKTVEDSTEAGQLKRYHDGLIKKFRDSEVQMAYLTPFNRNQAGNVADSLPTVQEFDTFKILNPEARHVSWLDLANVAWDGNGLWNQHRAYVLKHISSRERLSAKEERCRDLAFLFGAARADEFWKELRTLKTDARGNRVVINLAEQPDLSRSIELLVGAFEKLLGSDSVVDRERSDDFSVMLRRRFLGSKYGEVHSALFHLAERFDYVWIEGKSNYGVRTAHKDYITGVSLVTSDGPDRLFVFVTR